jgi:hypothetical protein
MPRLILKFRYWENKSLKQPRSSNYLKYIATREGVDCPDDSWMSQKATLKQIQMINTLVEKYPDIPLGEEYPEYMRTGTRGSASELIGTVLDDHPELLGGKTYLDYIGTRPGVEKFNSHGLFSDEGKTLLLSEEREKINAHRGRVYTLILSLKRDDAELTGFNSAERWRAFMRVQRDELSKRFDIPADSLQWYGAFHNSPAHPHTHVLLYSTDPQHPGYLTENGLKKLKADLATEIFKNQLTEIYQEQSERRDELTQVARNEIEELVMSCRTDSVHNNSLSAKLFELADKLKDCKGKKAYGYLPPDVKELVDSIVDEIENDSRIKKLYNLWYKSKYAILKTYTDHLPPKKPLSEENTFKPIRNAVIKETLNIQRKSGQADDAEFPEMSHAHSGDSNTDRSTELNIKPSAQISADTNYVHISAVAVIRLMKNVSQIFQDKINKELDEHPEIVVDSREQEEIEAKKKGQNINM